MYVSPHSPSSIGITLNKYNSSNSIRTLKEIKSPKLVGDFDTFMEDTKIILMDEREQRMLQS